MEHSIIPSICRACLSKTGEFKSVFISDDNSGYTIHLSEMIMACTSVQITFGDGLPEQICVACAEQTKNMYLFKLKCEESDKMLRRRLGCLPFQKNCNMHEDKYSEYIEMNDNNETDLNVIIKSEISIDEPHVGDPNDDKTQATFGFNESHNYMSNIEKPVSVCVELGEKKLKCEFCYKTFSAQWMLNRHYKSHSAIKEFECHTCKKRFSQNYLLLRHKITHQRTYNHKKTFICSTCHKVFNRLFNLRQHMNCHKDNKPFLCSTCGKGFATNDNLSVHIRKHTGARPFVCPICSRSFSTAGSLTTHKRIHSGEKPYECDVCKMSFRQSSGLSIHKRTHTGEKPYACKYCAKAFSQLAYLKSHLTIHTGEKPHICDVCERAFQYIKTMKKHKKTHLESTDIEGRANIHGGSVNGDFPK